MSLVNAVSSSTELLDMPIAGKENRQENGNTLQEMFAQLVQKRKEEYIAKIRSGSLEPSIPIGSGSYTDTEWKRLLRGFDAAEAELRKLAEEEAKKAEEEAQEKKIVDSDADRETKAKNVEMLLAEFTTATYPSGEEDLSDDVYYTFYTPEEIYCRKEGESETMWEIPLDDPSQYDRIMSYLQSLDSQGNLRFACHENFWRDFLSGQLDMEGFQNFLETRVVDGVPGYLTVSENGMNIDRESAMYAKYMNQPDFVTNVCYALEEFLEWQEKARVAKGQSKTQLSWVEEYYSKHPDEIGKRNNYYNGRWYSMMELAVIFERELAELFDQRTQKGR